MSGKARLCSALLVCALCLSGCMSSPPEALKRSGAEDQPLISASTADLAPDTRRVVLYFRYGNTACLAPEERDIPVSRNESLEKAVVRALIDGPALSSALSPLFPPGTEALAAVTQDDTLFVTFNEAVLGRYADEPGEASLGGWKEEGALRRRLCLDALTATLTEAGLCARVQVLVYRGSGQATSMRLQAGFLSRTQDESLLPPLTRDESRLLTPHNTARMLLEAWVNRDWAALYDFSDAGRPSEQSAMDAFASAGVLTGFSLSPGAVAPDGQSAVITADLILLFDGRETAAAGYPVRLNRENGLWKADWTGLMAMMNFIP